MKLKDVALTKQKPDFGTGRGIDMRKVRLVTKGNVMQDKQPEIDLPIVGVRMKQVQSTGDTSRVSVREGKRSAIDNLKAQHPGPFRVAGYYVEDRHGNTVAECRNAGVAEAIAELLNSKL